MWVIRWGNVNNDACFWLVTSKQKVFKKLEKQYKGFEQLLLWLLSTTSIGAFIPLCLLLRHFPPTNQPQTPTTQPPSPPHNHQTHAATLLHIPTYLKLLLSQLLQPILPTPTQARSTRQPLTTYNPRYHRHAAC